MIRLAFRSLRSRPLRTVLTTLAILLGVAMITGTYVLTDQIDKGFADIFETSFKGTAVIVEPRTNFGDMETRQAQTLDAGVLAQVRDVPGVARASGVYQTMGAAVVDGEAVETGGAPTILTANPGDPFNQGTIVRGRGVQERNEVAILRGFADETGLEPGDAFAVAAPAGLQQVRVVGVFEWGKAGSLGGAIVIAGRLQDVQRWGGEPDALSGVDVAAAPGVTPKELAARVDAALPQTLSVKTGAQATADATQQTAAAIGSFLKPVLLAFAGVSVFVGAFIIFNAFSITVAQRRREFAMLRALGASRRQVLAAVIAEALALGVAASAFGLGAGLGVAKGINALFRALGADIPTSGIVLEPRTILIAVMVGVGVTLLSALAPALRATCVPPVAALQEGAVLPPTRFARFTTAIAMLVGALGAGSLAWGMLSDGSANGRLLYTGLGALLLFVAIAMTARYVVRPLSRVIGWPLERLAPTSGRLARDNAGRNPSRTAATAAALMIGLAMVVFVAVFAQALKGSFSDSLTAAMRADLVVRDNSAYLTVPQQTVADLQRLPGVDAAAGVAIGQVRLTGGDLEAINGIDATRWTRVWRFDWIDGGSDALVGRVDAKHVVLEEEFADSHGLMAGDSFTVTAQTGKSTTVTVLGVYRDPMLLDGIVASDESLRLLGIPTASSIAFVRTSWEADTAATQTAVQRALAAYPTQVVLTRPQYLDQVNEQVDQILTMFYGLLAMSVVISIIGIVNTLVLSVHERTREIGLLRAIGATRRQLRHMVRYESVITAVIGGLLGTAVGVAFAYTATTQLGGHGLVFSVPWTQLGIFLLLVVIVGVVAAVLPARRAANTRILEAIRYE